MEPTSYETALVKVTELLEIMEQEGYDGNYNEIDKIIRCIKDSQNPRQFSNVICTRLNQLIRMKNMKMVANRQKPRYGVIAQLTRDPKDYITLAALLCGGECQSCQCCFSFTGNAMLDVYAPVYCPLCKSVNINIIKWDSSLPRIYKGFLYNDDGIRIDNRKRTCCWSLWKHCW